ncbi:hypothetical protein P1X15_21360 [Runella sp. MFBS21]|uniref:hypothetical protein n=1 Tax=Runella sp. MFBS21 TaxID=3034018 RepID=UPI0023F691A1|nr:hypothetical protein [Runella sp. MFBS21]MDF7820182.1 hypothetical protein [Runella sp. MFBS21]
MKQKSYFIRRTKKIEGQLAPNEEKNKINDMRVDQNFIQKLEEAHYKLYVSTGAAISKEPTYDKKKLLIFPVYTNLLYHIFIEKGNATGWRKFKAAVKKYGLENEVLEY